MPRTLRLALALLALGILMQPGEARAEAQCPNAFWAPSTGTCGMTGRTKGGGCICEYDCEIGGDQWFDFCDQ
jgi:hypothetical protein